MTRQSPPHLGSDPAPTLSLSLAELFKIAVDLGKFVSTIWALYVTIVISIVGWLVAIKAPISPHSKLIASAIILLSAGFFCFVIEFQHGKIRKIYELIRIHPELNNDDSEFKKSALAFAAPFMGLTNRIFLPIIAAVLVALLWSLPPIKTD